MDAWLRITLVTLTVGGGFSGVASIIQAAYQSQQGGVAVYLAFAIFFLLYIYVMVSGLLLVHKPNSTGPMALALALQTPRISSPWLVYRLTVGADAFIGIRSPDELKDLFHLDFGFYFGSRWAVALLQENRWSFGVNILALVLLILVFRSGAKKRVALDKQSALTEVESAVDSQLA